MAGMTEVARVEASPGRRMFGLGVLICLGLLLFWLALSQPGGSMFLRIVVLAIGALAIWAAREMRRATAQAVILTEAGLVESTGTVIAPMEQIEAVDRGTFAFKPSNGFLVRLSQPGPRVWRPGLYWRIGRRVGIGGVAHAAQAKAMADALSVMLAERAGAGQG
ncbi:hypothetical protein [Pseudooceanicola sp. LIPI14-2-Ac024]|uniref:hypothetical protein n=1 Tax=Pseudooceanicola sp. LIPI14-2-Ac024 TaxID=3344875 RepID=UPI0035CFFB61